MSFLMPPSPPSPPAPAPVARDDGDEEARRRERQATRLRVGRAATILTGGAGLAGASGSVRKNLLGE